MTTAITLDKQDYPLMMHLSILPKYDISDEHLAYDSITQSSTFNSAMSGSWCTRSASSAGLLGIRTDDDQNEDD